MCDVLREKYASLLTSLGLGVAMRPTDQLGVRGFTGWDFRESYASIVFLATQGSASSDGREATIRPTVICMATLNSRKNIKHNSPVVTESSKGSRNSVGVNLWREGTAPYESLVFFNGLPEHSPR